MANTFSHLNIHVVFTVLGKENLLLKSFRTDLFKYIAGILNKSGEFSLAVNGYQDYVHAFFEMKPSHCLSNIVQVLKTNSSKWINDNQLIKGKFAWQEGYGSFSYSRTQRNNVINYIINQETHHQKNTFREEYLDLLNKFEIEYDPRYLFEVYDD